VLQICSRIQGKPNCHLACCLVGNLHVHTSPPRHRVPRGNKLVIKEFNKCTPEAEGPVCRGCWPVKIWPRNCHMKIPQLPVNTGSTRDHIVCGWSYQSTSKQPLCYHILNMVSTKVQKHKHISVSHPINNCVWIFPNTHQTHTCLGYPNWESSIVLFFFSVQQQIL
jgi:hypothetical protein